MEGQVAVVTGGASGIGRGVVEIFLKHHAKVCIVDINEDLGIKVGKELSAQHVPENVLFLPCDVTNAEAFEDMLKVIKAKFGRLDILVNNAGTLDESNIELTLSLNLGSVIRGTQLGLQYVDRGGAIINTASLAGLLPVLVMPAYSASKWGVIGLTTSLALMSREKYGIRVNCICPAFVDIPLVRDEEGEYGNIAKKAVGNTSEVEELIGSLPPLMPVSTVADALYNLVQTDVSGAAVMVLPDKAVLLKFPSTPEEVEIRHGADRELASHNIAPK